MNIDSDFGDLCLGHKLVAGKHAVDDMSGTFTLCKWVNDVLSFFIAVKWQAPECLMPDARLGKVSPNCAIHVFSARC